MKPRWPAHGGWIIADALLFDTGPDESIFERNVIRLGVDMGGVDAMMLSHGHWDHAGAMPRALQMMTLANGGRRVPTYMHPDMFASRTVKAKDGRLMPMEDIPSEHVLAANGADLIIARNEQSVLSNTVFISGEIPRVTGSGARQGRIPRVGNSAGSVENVECGA